MSPEKTKPKKTKKKRTAKKTNRLFSAKKLKAFMVNDLKNNSGFQSIGKGDG
ncbi:MAG: hypothetical protein KAW12_02210 [Candidatus Aminicenantes bacterium]|nr:hypothetical protein [Candidatus Aminicenantes bacterium]